MNFKAILIAATLVVGSAAFAQAGAKAGGQKGGAGVTRQGGPGAPGGPGGGQRRMRTPEERVEQMGKALGLNADQKKKVLAVYKASGAKSKTIFEDKKMNQDQKRAAFDKMRDENAKKIKAILTKDQAKKFDEMRQRRGPGGPGRGPGGATGGPVKAGGKVGTKAGGKG